VVHGRVLVELGDGRKHAEGIGREEDDDVRRALGTSLDHRVVDELHGICNATVLGEGVVVVVRKASGRVDHDVFAHRAKANGIPDLRFGLAFDVDGLRVAPTLDVEDRLLGPAVLVIADEHAILCGGKRGLTGAGEAEEDRRAMGTRVHVARAVHGENVILYRQQVVHN